MEKIEAEVNERLEELRKSLTDPLLHRFDGSYYLHKQECPISGLLYEGKDGEIVGKVTYEPELGCGFSIIEGQVDSGERLRLRFTKEYACKELSPVSYSLLKKDKGTDIMGAYLGGWMPSVKEFRFDKRTEAIVSLMTGGTFDEIIERNTFGNATIRIAPFIKICRS
jgi:hypothetical protein